MESSQLTASFPLVFIIDDDDIDTEALARIIRSAGLQIKTFTSAEKFLQHGHYESPCCLLLDMQLPGINGLNLQKEMEKKGLDIPIIFITGHGDIPISVQAMKHGAVDFITKPPDDKYLLNAISKAIALDTEKKSRHKEVKEIQQRIDSLTQREYQIFTMVVGGMLNKNIASTLGISEKTVKVHRANVMRKMQTKSLAELVRIAEKAKIAWVKV